MHRKRRLSMNRALGLILLCGLIAGPCLVTLAQEELPPPPPTPAPRQPVRGERLERLRQLGGRVIDGLANPAPGQGPTPAAGVDVERLNEGVEELVEPLVTRDPAVRSLRLYFDPHETNLAQDRVTLTALF